MSSSKDALSNELADLFVATAETIRSRLADKGIFETYSVNGWQGKKGISEVNIMYRTLYVDEISDLWQHASETVVDKMYGCAEKLNLLSETLPFWAEEGRWYIPIIEPKQEKGGSLEFDKNPTEWILTYLLRPALHAGLADLPTVSSADLLKGHLFAEEVISVALSNYRQYTVSFNMVVLKAKVADAINVGDLSLQNIDDNEDSYIKSYQSSTLNLKLRTPRSAAYHVLHLYNDVHGLVTALQLLGFDAEFESAPYVSLDPNWYATPRWERIEDIPNQYYMSGEKQAIVSSDLEDVADIMAKLKTYNFLQPQKYDAFAIHQFRLGMSRETHADALVNFVIVLEALLLEGETTELTYRFKLNGAHYLSDKPADRESVFKALGELYGLRSRLVHGSRKYPSETELEERCLQAYHLSRLGLLRAIKQGFPTADNFRKWALGIESAQP